MIIRRLRSADESVFEQAMALYAISFPYHEQREAASQRKVLSHEDYHFGLVMEEDSFVGLILYWETDSLIYVEHFCILPERRGQGLGTKVLEQMGKQGKTVVLEIDPPVDAAAKRRKGFYERGGFVENPYFHVHPPYHKGHTGHELVVMSYPKALVQEEYTAFAAYLKDTVMAGEIN